MPERQMYLEIMTCNPLIYTIDHPKFVVSNQEEESISSYCLCIFFFLFFFTVYKAAIFFQKSISSFENSVDSD